MASKTGGKCKRSYYRAQLVNTGTCVFCRREVDNEIIYGKLYVIGDIHCHYFCALLSCCLIQKGKDDEGLFGFLYPDIIAEVERSKKHKCSYCNREGASLGCSVSQCRKQFHLPCGRERNAISLFYGNYKTFCENHGPKQKITEPLAGKIKSRMAEARKRKQLKLAQNSDKAVCDNEVQSAPGSMCVICYEEVQDYPTMQTFWPPCCARDAWFHRSCLQRMALSAGMHYLKCPLCNDKENFYQAVVNQGYYVPDRDAAWELEQNAFADIYERPSACCAVACKCPMGREHDSETGPWDIKQCILCGSSAEHAACASGAPRPHAAIYICAVCRPAAPADLDRLIASIERVQQQEQQAAARVTRRAPLMTSRMSLRQTKLRTWTNCPSSSTNLPRSRLCETENKDDSTSTESSRLELNLKKPKRRIFDTTARNVDNILLSPMKMLEQGLNEKMSLLDSEPPLVDYSKVLEKLKRKLKKPKPLVVKKKIINTILDELFDNLRTDLKSKEPLLEWSSPKKTCELKNNDCKINIINEIDVDEIECTQERNSCDGKIDILKDDSTKKLELQHDNAVIAGSKGGNMGDHAQCDVVQSNDTAAEVAVVDTQSDGEKSETNELNIKKKTTQKRKATVNCATKGDAKINSSRLSKLNANLKLKLLNSVKKIRSSGIKAKGTGEVEKENRVYGTKKRPKMYNFALKNKVKGDRVKKVINLNETHTDSVFELSITETQFDNEDEEETVVAKKRRKIEGRSKTMSSDNSLIKNKCIDYGYDDFKEKMLVSDKEEDSKIRNKKLPAETVNVHVSKRKHKNINSKFENDFKLSSKRVKVNDANFENVTDLTFKDNESRLKLKCQKKHKRDISLRASNVKLKIRWRERRLKLEITKKKTRKLQELATPKVLKQYVLQYSPEMVSPSKLIAKPEKDLSPIKRKCVKTEKNIDNLVQTDISSFFVTVPRSKQ